MQKGEEGQPCLKHRLWPKVGPKQMQQAQVCCTADLLYGRPRAGPRQRQSSRLSAVRQTYNRVRQVCRYGNRQSAGAAATGPARAKSRERERESAQRPQNADLAERERKRELQEKQHATCQKSDPYTSLMKSKSATCQNLLYCFVLLTHM